VDPSASSKRPIILVSAPVYAPFSRPKSSLSISVGGSVVQLTVTKRSVFSQTHAVDGSGQQFFPRAGFPQEENRRVCLGNLLREGQDLLHRNALPYDVCMLNQES